MIPDFSINGQVLRLFGKNTRLVISSLVENAKQNKLKLIIEFISFLEQKNLISVKLKKVTIKKLYTWQIFQQPTWGFN